MKNVMGIINLIEGQEQLQEFSLDRTVAAIPFGGRYRLVDAILSNLVNGGVYNVGVFVQSKYRSLMDHLRSGKAWDLHRKRDGLFILPPDGTPGPMGLYRGDMEAFNHHLDYIEKSHQQYVIIAGGNMFCNVDLRAAYEFHLRTGGDITVLYQEQGAADYDLGKGTVLELDARGQIVGLGLDRYLETGQKASMEMYIMAKATFLELISSCLAKGQYSLVKDGLLGNLSKLKIYGYPYHGYLARINSLASYYRHSMELLDPVVWRELFYANGSILTKAKDEAPTKYLEQAQVKNSLVSSGCLIEGQVEGSILFRKVAVCHNAVIKNSVIMAKCIIEDGVTLENVILDKDVRITSGKVLRGEANYPFFVGKNTVI